MAANEINRNCSTRYCIFAIDGEEDLKILPTSKRRGLDEMSSSMPCSQGSIARTTDGKCYILDGKDIWKYSSGGSGNTDGSVAIDGVEPIPQTTIESLFG